MSTSTTNFALGKGVDADNAEVYLTVTLPAALDIIDTNLRSVTGGFTVVTGGLTVTAGNAAVNSALNSFTALVVGGALSGNTSQWGITAQPVGGSGATTEVSAVYGQAATAAAAFTCTTAADFHAVNPTTGAASTITNKIGLLVDAMVGTANGGATSTNCIGVDIAAPSGATTLNLGLRNAGTTLLTGLVTLGGNLALGGSGGVIQGGTVSTNFNNNASNATNLTIADGGGITIPRGLGARVAGDVYLIVDANGVLHKSAIGPAS